MSAFLAPIHTWLFNKIKLAQDLEKDIVNLHIDKFKCIFQSHPTKTYTS